MVFNVEIRPYGARLHFTTDPQAFLAERAKHTDQPLDLGIAAGCSSDFHEAMLHVVGVFDGSVTTLAHELAHVCIKVLGSVGIPIEQRTSEAFCYLLEDLMAECLPLIPQAAGLTPASPQLP